MKKITKFLLDNGFKLEPCENSLNKERYVWRGESSIGDHQEVCLTHKYDDFWVEKKMKFQKKIVRKTLLRINIMFNNFLRKINTLSPSPPEGRDGEGVSIFHFCAPIK